MAAGTGRARSVTARSRTGLSRPAVLAAALRLVDAEGLGAVTTSRLAAELGCGAMTLYGYYRSRDELLDAVCSELVGAAASSSAADGDDWCGQLHGLFVALRDAFAAHPGVVAHLVGRPVVSAGTLRPADAALRLLRAGGLDDAAAVEAFVALYTYTVGNALAQAAYREVREEKARELAVHRLRIAALPAGLDVVAELAPQLAEAVAADDLRWGIDRILGCFARRAGEAPGGPTA